MALRLKQTKTLYCDPHFYASFPSVVQALNGDILVAFRRAPDHRWLVNDQSDAPLETDFDAVDHIHCRSHIAQIRLNRALEPKGPVVTLPTDPEASDQDANLLLLSSGRILQYGFLFYPLLPEYYDRLTEQGVYVRRNSPLWGVDYLFWGAYVRSSDDHGYHWSDRYPLPVSPAFKGQNKLTAKVYQGGPLRGRAIEQEDGRVQLAVYRPHPENKVPEYTQQYWSTDQGESWFEAGEPVLMDGVHLQEPALAQWPQGQVTLFHRSKGLEAGDALITVSSENGGKSFSAPKVHDCLGHPYDPLVLRDGRLFLVYGYRRAPCGVRARLVYPGQTIDDVPEFTLFDGNPGRDCGYPWAVELDTGDIAVTYYKTYENGLRGIELALLEVDPYDP